MANRGLSAKVRLRHEALTHAVKAVADGLYAAGVEIVTEAGGSAPDSPYDPYPTGEGLPKQGGVLAYVGNQKVNGMSLRGSQPAKPRAARTLTRGHSVTVIVGFGFPARFAETGTVDTPAQPFLAPTRDRRAGGVPAKVASISKPEIGGR